MDNDKAIAASAAMVALAAVGSGALFFSAQTGASDVPAEPAPPPQVVVEYVDAAGNVVTLDSADPIAMEPVPSSEYDDDHDEDDHDEDDHDEYDHDEYDHDEYDHDEYEDDHDEDEDEHGEDHD